MLKTCIIPAAGRGTRWAPISGYLPKEMLPLIDRPVIEWVIDQATASGCQEVLVVINKQKQAIKDYLSKNKKLNKRANVSFVNQTKPLGVAHAMLLCQKLVGNNPFGVILPDLPTISRKPVMKQLIQAFEKEKEEPHVVSFDKFSNQTMHFYSECLIKPKKHRTLTIKHFCPKNSDPTKPHHRGNTTRMSGNFIFGPKIFPVIKMLMKNRKVGEISDRNALRTALESGQKIIGVKIEGHTYDTGYPKGYVRANTAFFKKFLAQKS